MSQCPSTDLQTIVNVMQSNQNNSALTQAFFPVLHEFLNMLKNEYNSAVNEAVIFTNVEIVQFDAFADMLHVLSYNLIHNPPLNEPLLVKKLAKIYSSGENIYRSFAQYGRGMLDESAGKFFASTENLQELVDASVKMLDQHDPDKSLEFIQVA